MIYMFLSNNPSSGDINSSNLSCSKLVFLKIPSGTIAECQTGSNSFGPDLGQKLFSKVISGQ